MATSRIYVYCQHCEAAYPTNITDGATTPLACPKCQSPTVVPIADARPQGASRLALLSVGVFIAALLAIAAVLYYVYVIGRPQQPAPIPASATQPVAPPASFSPTVATPPKTAPATWEQLLGECERRCDWRTLVRKADDAWKADLPDQAAQAYRLALRLVVQQTGELSKQEATIRRKLVTVESAGLERASP